MNVPTTAKLMRKAFKVVRSSKSCVSSGVRDP